MYPLARASDPSSPPAGILMMGLNLRRRILRSTYLLRYGEQDAVTVVYARTHAERLVEEFSAKTNSYCRAVLRNGTGRGSRRAAPVRLRTQSTALIDRDSGTNPPLRARTGGLHKT